MPLHLSYRIFESSPKRIKLSEDNKEFKQSLSNSGISPAETKDEQPTKRGWKEVQLKISETGVMSVTDISSPDSKKSTKVKEIESQSSSNLLQNVETLESVNKPTLALEDESNRSSTSKAKNLTSESGERKSSLETKRKGNVDSLRSQELKLKKDEVKNSKQFKEIKEKDKKETNKKDKRELQGKKDKEAKDKRENREEFEITSRVLETEKPIKKNQIETTNSSSKEKSSPSGAGSKIDALSAKLQFQPKVGQVNNTYSKKTLKDKRTMQASKKTEAKKDGKSPELSESLEPPKFEVSKTSGITISKSSVSKNSGLINSTSVTSTYVTAPSISTSSERNSQSISLQQALNSLGRDLRPQVNTKLNLLNQLNSNQKSIFRNNNLPPSNESLASIGLNVSTAMVMSQGSNFDYMMPDLGILSPSSKSSQVQSGSPVQSISQAPTPPKLQSSSSVQSSSIQSPTQIPSSPVQSSSQVQTSQIQASSQSKIITSGSQMPQYNVQPSMSIYSISTPGKNNLYSQASSKSSKSDFEITSVYSIPPCPDTIPISLKKPSIRKHEIIAKGTNLNEICAKIGTSGSKINDICAKIGENSKEKNKTESRRTDLPELLKITKTPSTEFIKHIPNIPNVPIYTPSGNSSSKDLERKNSILPVSSGVSISQKAPQKKHPQPVGYKTLRDPPKSWNPTLSKNNYITVKNQKEIQNQIQSQSQGFSDGTGSKPILSKPAKIFKMRNMPRYLGNPASGVKPMYGISNDKEKEQSLKNINSNTMNAVNTMGLMKIDPKTLSPIVSTVNSPIVSPPPYSPNARSYQNSPFSRDICRNTGSPISPRNSPVNMLSTNPFIPSPTPNTNPRLIYSHFPPPYPDASRFPNPLIRTPVGIPPPSAFHSSLPPSINKLYQRSSYIPQTSGYNPVAQPSTVQRIPPSTHTSSTSSASFNLGQAETVVSSSESIRLGKSSEKVFNLSKSDDVNNVLSEGRLKLQITLDENCKEISNNKVDEEKRIEEKIDLESKVNGDIDLVEEIREVNEKKIEKEHSKDSSKELLSQSLNDSKELLKQSLNEAPNESLKEPSKELSMESLIQSSNESLQESAKDSSEKNSTDDLKERSKGSSKESLTDSAKESTKDSSKESSKDNLKESTNDSSKDFKESTKKEENKNFQENLAVEKSQDLSQEKLEEVEKEIQGKKSEIQRNKAES